MRSAIATANAVRAVPDAPPWIFEHVDFLPEGAIGRAVRSAAARADRIVCISEAIARDLDPAGAVGERIEVIHGGIDVARFAPDARGGAHENEVLLLGAIVPWKRPDFALEVVARAARVAPDIRLRIGGSPLDDAGEALLARMRQRAAAPDLDGRVTFAGQIGDPAAAL